VRLRLSIHAGRLTNIHQVLRYTALGLGVLYGFQHQRKITTAQKAEAARKEYEHKESLIQKAKAEYARLHNPRPATGDGSTFSPRQHLISNDAQPRWR
jgi:F-type H+-transporting ATP synthase subunit e